jgi:transcriptional regulator with XRE-family HTH domain
MEIAILVKAKQGYIYRYMLEHNMSAAQLAREIGVDSSGMGRIINFQWTPPQTKKRSRYTEKLESYFKIPIEILFPPELTAEIAQKLNRKHVRFEEVELLQLEGVNQKYLVYNSGNEDALDEEFRKKYIDKILCTLMPREEKVLRLAYGIGTERV